MALNDELLLTPQALARIEKAVAQAEQGTSCEIAVVLAPASSRYEIPVVQMAALFAVVAFVALDAINYFALETELLANPLWLMGCALAVGAGVAMFVAGTGLRRKFVSGAQARKAVDLDYFSPRTRATTSRRVDPYGLALRRGVWNLVGWCHLRKELRTFHVHRIRQVTMQAARPKQADFSIPEDFSIDAHVASWPWEYRIHAPVEVTLTLDETLAPLAPQLFGAPARGGTLRLTVTHLDALLDQVLSMGTSAKLVGPSQARDRLRERAERVLAAHTPGAAS